MYVSFFRGNMSDYHISSFLHYVATLQLYMIGTSLPNGIDTFNRKWVQNVQRAIIIENEEDGKVG